MDMTHGRTWRGIGPLHAEPRDADSRNQVGQSLKPTHPPSGAVELHIEQLVLHGLSDIDHTRLGSLIETELVQLFALHGIPQSWLHHSRTHGLTCDAIDLTPGAEVESLARQIARTVYGGTSQ